MKNPTPSKPFTKGSPGVPDTGREGPGEDQWLMGFQRWLDRINRRHGNTGAMVTVGFWVLVLLYAVVVIFEEYF